MGHQMCVATPQKVLGSRPHSSAESTPLVLCSSVEIGRSTPKECLLAAFESIRELHTARKWGVWKQKKTKKEWWWWCRPHVTTGEQIDYASRWMSVIIGSAWVQYRSSLVWPVHVMGGCVVVAHTAKPERPWSTTWKQRFRTAVRRRKGNGGMPADPSRRLLHHC